MPPPVVLFFFLGTAQGASELVMHKQADDVVLQPAMYAPLWQIPGNDWYTVTHSLSAR